jgi:hypothetical protein
LIGTKRTKIKPGDIAQVVISIINRPRLWILTPQIRLNPDFHVMVLLLDFWPLLVFKREMSEHMKLLL